MLAALKRSRFTRFALLLAGVLAISGSFGLHPEPVSWAEPAAARMGWASVNLSGSAAPHDCLACLAHRSFSLPGLSAVVLRPGSRILAAHAATPSLLARLEATLDEGRAPPVLD